jgi:hypothetical protein
LLSGSDVVSFVVHDDVVVNYDRSIDCRDVQGVITPLALRSLSTGRELL